MEVGWKQAKRFQTFRGLINQLFSGEFQNFMLMKNCLICKEINFLVYEKRNVEREKHDRTEKYLDKFACVWNE